MIKTITAITRRMWIKPPMDEPPIPPIKPRAHKTIKIRIIVQSIAFPPGSLLPF